MNISSNNTPPLLGEYTIQKESFKDFICVKITSLQRRNRISNNIHLLLREYTTQKELLKEYIHL